MTVDGEDVGTGRLVLLHDPAGNDAWEGTFRCVAYARAEIDPELVTDPLLAGVGWTWLTEALDAHGATYVAPSGTVTRVASESFGGMADEGATAQLEIRASWTRSPTGEPERSTSGRTSRRGARCCAPRPGCPRSPRVSRRSRAAAGSAAEADAHAPRRRHRRRTRPTPERRGPTRPRQPARC